MSSAQQHKEGEHNLQVDSDSDDEQRDQKVVSPDVSSSPDKKRSKPSMPSMSTPTMPIQIASNNNIKDNDHDHQQQMSPAAASSSIASPSSNSREHSSSLPLWVAGSSPAKFVSLEDLIKMGDSIEKMAIVHQIAVDPKCTVEDLRPPQSPIYEQVKSSMHKAYWDLLRADLAEHPPKTEHAFALFEDLKKMITDHLESANLKNALAAVDEALDLDHLRQLLHRGQLHFPTHLHSILAILERLCAPVRDDLVAKLLEEADTVELFRGIFNLVELMQLDMANFTLSQNRQLIGSYSAKIEFDEFQKLLAIDKAAADNTRLWLRQVLVEYFEQNQPEDGPKDGEDQELSRSTVNELIVQFYVRLLETPPTRRPHPFPETLRLDMARVEALGEKQLQLELAVGALFVTTNLAGKAAASEGQRNNNFKAELKRQLLVLLNDVSWDNYPEKLENVALQCMKQCKQAAVSADGCWPEERSQLLRQQICGLTNPEDSVRTIARNRIRDFICQALRQTSQPLRIPLGLSVAQTELASLTSRFYAVATHNWTAFGRFYGQLLEEEAEQYNRMEGEKRRKKNIGGDGDEQ